jgi:hypothetical protein
MAALLVVLLLAYLIAAHWLGWLAGLLVPALLLVALTILGHWLGKREKPHNPSENPDTDAATDAPVPPPAAEAEPADTASPQDFPELKAAIAALQADAYAECIRQAEPYCEDDRLPLCIDALRLCALGWSRLEDYPKAVSYWDRLVAIGGGTHDWLSVAATRAMAQDFAGAEAAFQRMQQMRNEEAGAEPGKSIFMPQETVVYLAALDRAGCPDLALPLLEQLAGFYRSLKITDSQFLFGHGMPFFEAFLRNSLSIVRKLKTPEEVRDWYRPIHDAVDEAGKRMFEEGGGPY